MPEENQGPLPKSAEAAKVQPKKEEIRINLPPKPKNGIFKTERGEEHWENDELNYIEISKGNLEYYYKGRKNFTSFRRGNVREEQYREDGSVRLRIFRDGTHASYDEGGQLKQRTDERGDEINTPEPQVVVAGFDELPERFKDWDGIMKFDRQTIIFFDKSGKPIQKFWLEEISPGEYRLSYFGETIYEFKGSDILDKDGNILRKLDKDGNIIEGEKGTQDFTSESAAAPVANPQPEPEPIKKEGWWAKWKRERREARAAEQERKQKLKEMDAQIAKLKNVVDFINGQLEEKRGYLKNWIEEDPEGNEIIIRAMREEIESIELEPERYLIKKRDESQIWANSLADNTNDYKEEDREIWWKEATQNVRNCQRMIDALEALEREQK